MDKQVMEEAIRLRRPLKSIIKNGTAQEKKQGIRFAESELKTSSPFASSHQFEHKLYTGDMNHNVGDTNNITRKHGVRNTSPIKSFTAVHSPVLENLRRQRMPERQMKSVRRPLKKKENSFGFLESLNSIGSKFMETILQNEPTNEGRDKQNEPSTQLQIDTRSESHIEPPNTSPLIEPVRDLGEVSQPMHSTLGFKEEVIAQLAELKETVESLSQKLFQLEREKQEMTVENMVLQNSMQDMRDRMKAHEAKFKQFERGNSKAIENESGRKRRHEDDSGEMSSVECKVRKLQDALDELKQSKAHKEIREAIRKNPANKY